MFTLLLLLLSFIELLESVGIEFSSVFLSHFFKIFTPNSPALFGQVQGPHGEAALCTSLHGKDQRSANTHVSKREGCDLHTPAILNTLKTGSCEILH